ncbi:MAG: hypothetical protein AAB394_00015 [Patescibacteria group bacterium]
MKRIFDLEANLRMPNFCRRYKGFMKLTHLITLEEIRRKEI